MPAAGGSVLGAAASQANVANGRGFSSVLDGYLGEDSATGDPREPRRQTPGEGHRNDDLTMPISTAVRTVATPPITLAWGLAQPQDHAASGGTKEFEAMDSGGSGSASETAVRTRLSAAGVFTWDLALLQDGMAAKVDPADGTGAKESLDAAPELAFGARLMASGAALSGANVEDGATSTESGRSQAKNTEIPESRNAHAMSLAGSQSESQNTTREGTPNFSGSQEDGRNSQDRRNADAAVSVAAKAATLSNERPLGGRADDWNAGLTDTQSAWTTAAAGPDGEAQTAVPAPESTQTGPVVPEAAEPQRQPASRDVSLHLGEGEGGVDIRMAERGGEIRVMVHTPDHDLANSLRAELPDLVGKLRQNGFQAETWSPAAAAQSDAGRRGGSDAPPSQQHSQGNHKDGRQRPPQQQQPKDQSRWAGEWKSTLDPAQESHI
jgi:hypothetical protein